jgi:hypothetical protein
MSVDLHSRRVVSAQPAMLLSHLSEIYFMSCLQDISTGCVHCDSWT